MRDDRRKDVARGVLAEDRIDVAGLGDLPPVVEVAAVDPRQRLDGLVRARRRKAAVEGAMHEQGGNGEAAQLVVAQVVVGPVGPHHVAGAGDRREMPEGGQVGLAEHLGQGSEGRLVELAELVELSVERGDAPAGEVVAAVLGAERIGKADQPVHGFFQLRATDAAAGVDQRHAGRRHQIGRMQEGQQPLRPPRHDGVGRDLRDRRRPHTLQTRQHRHAEGHGAEAMRHHLHRAAAGLVPHVVDRRAVIVRHHRIGTPLLAAVGKLGACPVVEQPAIVARRIKILEQVGLDRVDREDQARHAQPMQQDDRALGAAAVARETQLLVVERLEEMHLRRAGTQRPLGAAHARIEDRRSRERAAETVEDPAGKEAAEPRHHRQTRREIGRVGHGERAELGDQVGQRDVQRSLVELRAGLVGAAVDGDREGRGVMPQVEAAIVVDLLDAAQEVAAAVARDQRQGIVHLLGLDAIGIGDEQVEAPARYGERIGRQRRRLERTDQVGLVLAILDEPHGVARGNGDDDGGLGLLSAARRLDGPRHALGEANADRLAGIGIVGRRARRQVDRAALAARQPDHRALGHRGYRQQGVDAQRARHHRAVADVEIRMHGRSARTGKDAAFAVDDTRRGIGTHGAAAERVHGDQPVTQQFGPDRVGHVCPAGRRDCLADAAGDAFVDRLVADARPVEAQAILGQAHPPLGAVVRHDQEGLRVVDGAAIGSKRQALDLAADLRQQVAAVGVAADDLGARRHDGGKEWAQAARDGALLDHHAVVELLRAAQVDQAGDGRPDRPLARQAWAIGRRLDAEADPVDRHVVVVAEGQDVTVAGKGGAETGRRRQTALMGAQQDLGRAQRAGRQHHDARRNACLVGREIAPAQPLRHVADGPSLAAPLDRPHADTAEDLRAAGHGVRQVVHQRGVLGADIAARAAIAAQRAGALMDTGAVDAVGEGHVDRRPRTVGAHRRARALERLEFVQVGTVLRIGRGRQHGDRPRIAFLQVGIVDARRPLQIVEHALVGLQRHVGVDQGRAAQTASHQDVHVGIDAKIVDACRSAVRADLRALELELPECLGRRVGILARQPFQPALEKRHAVAHARQARGRHAATVARTDDDGVVVRQHRRQGLRQSLHGHSPQLRSPPSGVSTDLDRLLDQVRMQGRIGWRFGPIVTRHLGEADRVDF